MEIVVARIADPAQTSITTIPWPKNASIASAALGKTAATMAS